jgi:hypothetical protein
MCGPLQVPDPAHAREPAVLFGIGFNAHLDRVRRIVGIYFPL